MLSLLIEHVELVLGVLLLIIAFFTGTITEKRHFASLHRREQAAVFIPVASFGKHADLPPIETVRLVSGSTVLAADYFKNFLSSLVSLFGGRISALESVLDRGRREATLRLMADAAGADCILNLRYETSCVSETQNASEMPKVEIFAYGTAIYLKK